MLFFLLALVFGQPGRSDQTRRIPPGLTNRVNLTNELSQINDLTKIAINPFLSCRLEQTYDLLGWTQNTPIYNNRCVGFCLSFFPQLKECKPRYTYRRVSDLPYSRNIKYVRFIDSCDCTPKRCKVDNRYYNHGQTVYDNCNRKCECYYGNLRNCCRQRKSFVDLSFTERQRYIDTYKIISTTPPYQVQYNSLVQSHQTLFGSGIHNNAQFLPWHRYFILELENILQQVDCRVTVPYWDWSKQANNPLSGNPWTNSNNWLGENGNCVTTGPFGTPGWNLVDNTCLRRNFNLGATFATPADIAQMKLDFPNNYNGMRVRLEAGPGFHNSVHCAIGGTMCSSRAAEAPEFFLHHCFIDKLWNDWQKLDPANVLAYSGNLDTAMPGTSTTPREMMDLNAGTRICYINSRRWIWFDELAVNLQEFRRIPVTPSQTDWLEMLNFNISEIREQERVRNSFNIISHDKALELDSIGRELGIDINIDNEKLRAVGCLGEDQEDDLVLDNTNRQLICSLD